MVRNVIKIILFSWFLFPLCGVPPLPGLERLFVIADIPSEVHFKQLQRSTKKGIDPLLTVGVFNPQGKSVHMTFLYVGDIPHAQVPHVEQAIYKAIQTFKQKYPISRFDGFYALPGAHILANNAVVTLLHAPEEAYAFVGMLDQYVSAVTGQHSLTYIPHVTLGRLPLATIQTPELDLFLPTVNAPAGARGPAETFSISQLRLDSSIGKGYKTIASYDLANFYGHPGQQAVKQTVAASFIAFKKIQDATVSLKKNTKKKVKLFNNRKNASFSARKKHSRKNKNHVHKRASQKAAKKNRR